MNVVRRLCSVLRKDVPEGQVCLLCFNLCGVFATLPFFKKRNKHTQLSDLKYIKRAPKIKHVLKSSKILKSSNVWKP